MLVKRKSLFTLCALLLSIGSGCAATGAGTYVELDGAAKAARDAAANCTEDCEAARAEAEKADKRLRRFEHTVEKADEFFRAREICKASVDHIWFCQYINVGRVGARRDALKTLDEKVRAYRSERGACGCVASSDFRF